MIPNQGVGEGCMEDVTPEGCAKAEGGEMYETALIKGPVGLAIQVS